ncbi:MFS transporter [Paraburkholderia sp. BR10882]|uniref:MFS transporter n=1 Tax=unclassified Paraburkholderia TaxID=2615204 RepID=UPI0034CFF826
MPDSSRTTPGRLLPLRKRRSTVAPRRETGRVVNDPPNTQARLVLGICVAVGFTTLLDQSIFTMAVPRLRDTLHASAAQLQLIVSVYSMAFGIALVPAGRLGDIIGRRLLFLVGLAIFTSCSVLGGLANYASTVIAARLLQGIGAGMLNTQVLGLIQDQFHGLTRARALGRYASAGGLAAAAGPVLGGLLLAWAPHSSGWRLLFLANVPFGVAAFVLAWRHLPRSRPAGRRFSLDVPGLFLLSGATFALMGATLVTPRAASGSSQAWLCAAVAAPLLFSGWEWFYGRHGGTPILSRGLVRSPGYVLGTLVAMGQFASGLTIGVITTLYFLDNLRIGPTVFAALTVPGALGMMTASRYSWRFMERCGRAGVTCAIGFYAVFTALQGAAMLWLPREAIFIAYPLLGLLQGAASGLVHAPNQAMSLAVTGEGEGRGVAAGFYQLSQRLASAVAMSWGSGILIGAAARTGTTSSRMGLAGALGLALAFSAGAGLASVADLLRRRREESRVC